MIVGEAHVIVRAITTGVERDIRRAFRNTDRIGDDVGRNIGRGIGRGVSGSGGGIFDGIASAADGARAQFDSLIRTTYTLGPAIASLVGAVGALAGGFIALAGTVAGAIPSLLAIPNVLMAIAQAALTLKLAFGGVGQAISAGMKAAGGGGGGGRQAERDLTNFYRRIEDAKENLRRALEESNRQIYEAEERLAEAKQNFSRVMADADRKVAEAREKYDRVVRDGLEDISDAQNRLREVEEKSARDVVKAKQTVERAQLELNKAYEAGREEVQQLNFAAEDAVIAEKRAALELEKAREKLLRVQDLPPNDRARREAELAFAQADLNYRKAMDTNADMAKEQERLNREGVDGTQAVSRAKERLADATESQAEVEERSLRDVEKARLDLARTQRDADEAAIKAKEDIAKAEEDRARREIDALDAIADAERNLEKVIIKRLEAEYDAELALKRAVEDLEKAKKKGYAAGVGGANAYQNALDKLSKEQRQFVRYMVDTFIPAIDDLRAAAAKEFFPKLIPALENIRTRLFPALLPLLQKTGGVLGQVALDLSETLTSEKAIGQIEKIWTAGDDILRDLGTVADNALAGFLNLLEATIPLAQIFTGWLVKISKEFKGWLDTESEQSAFQTFLGYSVQVTRTLGKIFRDVFGGFGNIVSEQVKPGSGGWLLLEFFSNAAAKFKEFTGTNTDRLNTFFINTASNSKSILSGIGAFVKEILKLGENPNIGVFFDKIGELAPKIGELAAKFADAGPALMDFVTSFTNFLNATLDAGPIQAFWGTLTSIFDALTKVFQNPIIKDATVQIATLAAVGVALRTAWMLLKIPILGILEPLFKLWKLLNKLKIIQTIAFNFKMAVALFGAGPVALAVAAIVGLVAAIVAMWRESEKLRDAVKALIDRAITTFLEMLDRLKQKLDEALAPLGGLEGIMNGLGGAVNFLKDAFKFLGDILAVTLIPLLDMLIQGTLAALEVILGTLIDTLGWFIRKFIEIRDLFSSGDIFGGILKILETIGGAIPALLTNLVKNIFEAIKRAIGEDAWNSVVDGVTNALSRIGQIFQDAWNGVVNWIKSFLGISSPSKLFESIGNAIIEGIRIALTALLEVFTLPFRLAWEAVKFLIDNVFIPFWRSLPESVKTALTNLFGPILDFLKNAWTNAKSFVDGTLLPAIKALPETVAGLLKQLWEPIFILFRAAKSLLTGDIEGFKTQLRNLVTAVAGILSKFWSPLVDGISVAWGKVKSFWNSTVAGKGFTFGGRFGIPKVELKIPTLAQGGVIPAIPGGMLALIGEGGRPERVEPLDSRGLSQRDRAIIAELSGGGNGAKNVVVNVYPSPGMDEIEIANIVSREISFMMRRGAA